MHPESEITELVTLEGGGDATIRLHKFDRWLVAKITLNGMDLPRDSDNSYGSHQEAMNAATTDIERHSGKRVVRTMG